MQILFADCSIYNPSLCVLYNALSWNNYILFIKYELVNDLERLSQIAVFFPRCLCGHIRLALPSTPNILTAFSQSLLKVGFWCVIIIYMFPHDHASLQTQGHSKDSRMNCNQIRRKTVLECLCAFKGTWGLQLPVVLNAMWGRAEAQWWFELNANQHADILTVKTLICWICNEIRLNIQAAIKMFFGPHAP